MFFYTSRRSSSWKEYITHDFCSHATSPETGGSGALTIGMEFSHSLKNLVPSLRDNVVATLVALEDHTTCQKLGEVEEEIAASKVGELR